jgi:hypothetical protein
MSERFRIQRFAGHDDGRLEWTGQAPDRLPMLGRGQHTGHARGACVMEYVSVLAGEVFSDHPRCAHPALAHLARVVNDCIDDNNVRARLALLAPDMIGTRSRDQRVIPTLTLVCLRATARVTRTPGPELGHHIERASARLAQVSGHRRTRACAWTREMTPGALRARWAMYAAVKLAWKQAGRLPATARDRWLYDLLADGIDETRRLNRRADSNEGVERPCSGALIKRT